MIPWFHAHWLVLLFIVMSPCVCGNLFIQLSRPSITQDVVWIYSNSSSIQHTSADIASISYDEDIQPVMNLTQPSKSGLRGILYNRGLACSSPNQTSSSLFYDNNDIPRIALIQSGGPCSFADKLNWAQLDGAIGAIVYAENNNSINPENTVLIPPNSNVTIPAYCINNRLGFQLLHRLELVAKVPEDISNRNHSKQAVRILMMPADSGTANPWELTLIIMIVLLAVSFFASVAMHFRLRQKNRRLRRMVEEGLIPPPPEMLPMGKHVLDQKQIDELPTRIIQKDEDEAQPKSISSTNGAPTSDNTTMDQAGTTVTPAPTPSVTINLAKRWSVVSEQGFKADDIDDDTCVICLEGFKHGELVRELPCKHEYHCTCIDPWLKTKSAECPLCKFDCFSPPPTETVKQKSWQDRVRSDPLGILRRLSTATPEREASVPSQSPAQPNRPWMERLRRAMHRDSSRDVSSNSMELSTR